MLRHTGVGRHQNIGIVHAIYRSDIALRLGTAITHMFQSTDLCVNPFTLGVDMNSQWHFVGFDHVDGELIRS